MPSDSESLVEIAFTPSSRPASPLASACAIARSKSSITGKQIAHQLFGGTNAHLASLFGRALAIVVPFRLKAKVLIAHGGRFSFGLGDALGVSHNRLGLFLDGISLGLGSLGGFDLFGLGGRGGRFQPPLRLLHLRRRSRNLTRLLGGFVLTRPCS